MITKRISLGLIIGLIAVIAATEARDNRSSIEKYQTPLTNIYNINRYNRVHRKGNIWMNFTNWGFFGNYGPGDPAAMQDPEFPGTWAPQCEYPANSQQQYLFMGAVWVGALVQDGNFLFPRVSLGSEGWTGPSNNNFEFEPGEIGGIPQEAHGIRERSTIPNSYNRLGEYVTDSLAISEQDFMAIYCDTLTERFWTGTDIIDGPHFPLGIRAEQTSYSWSYNYADDFILIDYRFTNIASNFLRNLYVALYIDADVGWQGEGIWHEDDICGFKQWYTFTRRLPDGTSVPDSSIINVAYIADNDGRPMNVYSGPFTCPHVTGTRVVRAPNPRLQTSFNWWISNGDPAKDFGPSWQDDNSVGNWTQTYGTPNGDARKYFVMSNHEFDYDQVHVANSDYITANPQQLIDAAGNPIGTPHQWKIADATNAPDLANGYDTRYLLSWGPLGIFDHVDENGNDVYRLNPGEQFHMTIAYVAGANFHDINNSQGDLSGNNPIDPTKYNFSNLQYNAAWAARVFDNEMVDTKVKSWVNGEEVWTGDGWYGEDVGIDGLFAQDPGDSCVYFGVFQGIYPGPDVGERDGKLQPNEDLIWRPETVYDPRYGELNIGYMMGNGVLDPGDGIPDFKGPPPPPIPVLTFSATEDSVVLRWKANAEDSTYSDPFSQVQDFEGYRIWVSNTGLEFDYQLLAEFDKIDFAYYSITDSLASLPDNQTNMPAVIYTPDNLALYRKPVNTNTGFTAIRTNNPEYVYEFKVPAHPMYPRYYSVTSFDFGDYKSGTEPLETSRNANRIYVAPSGNPGNKVTVVPNPYRAYEDYTRNYISSSTGSGLSWENQDDGTPEFFPQQDRRLEFYNLPNKCLIRIYTVAGDLVQIIPHSNESPNNNIGDRNQGWISDYSEGWNLNSRNGQQIVSGIYLFSVEDLTPGNEGKIEVGKFVVIR
ncbi:MAG: hypothetical protein NTW14_11120 [bacterium]|nr:hypothetical protein [bacterium]